MDNTPIIKQQRYLIKWVGRCQYDEHDKIWGWFYYFWQGFSNYTDAQPVCYSFWARTGKTISFKKHDFNKWSMNRLVRQKQDKKYSQLAHIGLEEIWPSFYIDIEERFIFFLLKE